MAKYISRFTGEEIDRKARVPYFDPTTMQLYMFACEEDKDVWMTTRDENLVVGGTPFVLTGVQRRIVIDTANEFYFITTHAEANVEASFRSEEKRITAAEWQEKIEDFLVSVSVDKNATGNYVKVVDNRQVLNGQSLKVDIKKYLAIGNNRVRITATGVETGETKSTVYGAVLTSMYITPANFTWNLPFIEGRPYSLGGVNIGGNLDKTLVIRVSNELGYRETYEVPIGVTQFINYACYFDGLNFPTGGTGIYNVELWLEADTLKSDVLQYNIICVAAKDVLTEQLVAISNVPGTVKNYADNKLFDYVVYNAGKATASPDILVKATVNNNPTIVEEGTLANIKTGVINTYEQHIEIETHETNLTMTADISIGDCEQRATYKIDNSASYPAVSGATFYMNAASRKNSQENREKIINTINNQEINAEWTKMAWEDGVDGWTTDEEGRLCLAIPAHSKAVVDLSPLSSVSTKGKTIEFTFKVRNVADYNEPIISMFGNNRGIRITPANILVNTQNQQSALVQGIDFKDEETVHVLITYVYDYKVTYGNLCQIYVNGVKARSFEFMNDDNLAAPYQLELGNDSSDLYLYKAMVYDFGFDKQQAETNYVASLADGKEAAYKAINSFRYVDATTYTATINYDAVKDKFNTMVIEMLNNAELPHYGLSKEYKAYCNVEFSFVDLPLEYKVKAWKFILENCLIEGQGTTSMNYWLWNLRFRIDKSGNLIVIYPDNTEYTL